MNDDAIRAMISAKTMTQQVWDKVPVPQRVRCRSADNLSPQLIGLERKRVEVVDTFDEKRRFYVGMSTGWIPCHLEVKTRASSGGYGCDKQYKSVTVVGSR